jgi:hypothetical protein
MVYENSIFHILLVIVVFLAAVTTIGAEKKEGCAAFLIQPAGMRATPGRGRSWVSDSHKD